MLHCSLGRARLWSSVIALLGDRLRIVAPDLPGHGRSGDWTGQGDYLAVTARMAASFCTAPTLLIGHSFGAVAALATAAAIGPRAKALILIEPVFFAAAKGTQAYGAHEARMAPFAAAMKDQDHPKAARLFHGLWGGGVPFEALSSAQQAELIRRVHLIPATEPGIGQDSTAILAPGRLEALGVPTLLIAGDQSPQIIPAIHHAVNNRLPNARSVTIAGAGHMVPVTHPADVAELIAAHIGL